MIILLSGLSSSGKDTVADLLVKNHGFVKLGFADPLKRICKDVYGFTDLQLWGPSEERNKLDERYPRMHEFENLPTRTPCVGCGVQYTALTDTNCYLTPRYALQTLGTEWARNCYADTWVDYGIRTARDILELDEVTVSQDYSAQRGLYKVGNITHMAPRGVVISDGRFLNEFAAVHKVGSVVRVTRPGHEKPKWDHPSETEQLQAPDESFSYVQRNDGTLAELEPAVATMLQKLS